MMEDLVAKYLKLREKKQEIQNEYKEKIAKIDACLTKFELAMLTMMDEGGMESVRTKHGTAYKTIQRKVSAADWDAVKDFVLTNDYWPLLERRVSKSAAEQWEAQTGELPPGLNVFSEVKVNIRRS